MLHSVERTTRRSAPSHFATKLAPNILQQQCKIRTHVHGTPVLLSSILGQKERRSPRLLHQTEPPLRLLLLQERNACRIQRESGPISSQREGSVRSGPHSSSTSSARYGRCSIPRQDASNAPVNQANRRRLLRGIQTASPPPRGACTRAPEIWVRFSYNLVRPGTNWVGFAMCPCKRGKQFGLRAHEFVILATTQRPRLFRDATHDASNLSGVRRHRRAWRPLTKAWRRPCEPGLRCKGYSRQTASTEAKFSMCGAADNNTIPCNNAQSTMIRTRPVSKALRPPNSVFLQITPLYEAKTTLTSPQQFTTRYCALLHTVCVMSHVSAHNGCWSSLAPDTLCFTSAPVIESLRENATLTHPV